MQYFSILYLLQVFERDYLVDELHGMFCDLAVDEQVYGSTAILFASAMHRDSANKGRVWNII